MSIELAWAAGFFDGEGWVGTPNNHGHSKRTPLITVSQSGLEIPFVLSRFQAAVGRGKISGPNKIKLPNRKPAYRLNISGFENVQWVMVQLWSYLSPTKREQFTKALEKAIY